MSLLVETIRTEGGTLLNTSFHNERIRRTLYYIYGMKSTMDLREIITVPAFATDGIFKCRFVYDDKSTKVEFLPYVLRSVRSLKIVFDDYICYPYKYTNRNKINNQFEMRGSCDDILIIKNGLVTDTSYSNVIFMEPDGSWVTPSSFLLQGTRRSNLLQKGIIKEKVISFKDIVSYSEVKLINAMIGIDDSEGIPVQNIITGE
jgi:4-amino-4-deoxychorismate lyase